MMSDSAPIVEEVVVRLLVGDAQRYEWRCTPTDLDALAAGRLYADGFSVDGSIAKQLTSARSGDVIELRLPASVFEERDSPRIRQGELPSAEEFSELFRELFASVDARHENGGMHAAALAHEGRIVFQAEDVARHNAVDKAIGKAVLAGADVATHGMIVSARVSGEIARKAARSGVAWLASRSIPTTMAVQIAQANDMPIIGRAAGRNAHVYR